MPFLQYLDGETQKCAEESPRKELLTVLKMRILEEHSKRMSLEDRAIASLCTLDNSDERRMLVGSCCVMKVPYITYLML